VPNLAVTSIVSTVPSGLLIVTVAFFISHLVLDFYFFSRPQLNTSTKISS
jgi:hypothetical protein